MMREFADGFMFSNYAVAFIDILGQRQAYKGQGLLPTNEEDLQAAKLTLMRTISPIISIQKRSEDIVEKARSQSSSFRAGLPESLRPRFDERREEKLQIQHWSDGTVLFHSLSESHVKVPMNGLFLLLGVAGAHCILGLATKQPIRGGVEIAWGVELRPGELYGCAVAKAYELESYVAQYPRIVVGPDFCRYLEVNAKQDDIDDFSGLNRSFANACLELIAEDADGYYIVDYLGARFQQYFTPTVQKVLREKALEFIYESLDLWEEKRDEKLVCRYQDLLSYFNRGK